MPSTAFASSISAFVLVSVTKHLEPTNVTVSFPSFVSCDILSRLSLIDSWDSTLPRVMTACCSVLILICPDSKLTMVVPLIAMMVDLVSVIGLMSRMSCFTM